MIRGLTRLALDRSKCARSQCREHYFNSFALFHPLQPWFECKDLQQHKTLKQTKMLEINNAKRLTNIN